MSSAGMPRAAMETGRRCLARRRLSSLCLLALGAAWLADVAFATAPSKADGEASAHHKKRHGHDHGRAKRHGSGGRRAQSPPFSLLSPDAATSERQREGVSAGERRAAATSSPPALLRSEGQHGSAAKASSLLDLGARNGDADAASAASVGAGGGVLAGSAGGVIDFQKALLEEESDDSEDEAEVSSAAEGDSAADADAEVHIVWAHNKSNATVDMTDTDMLERCAKREQICTCTGDPGRVYFGKKKRWYAMDLERASFIKCHEEEFGGIPEGTHKDDIACYCCKDEKLCPEKLS
eukprot:TRINITY_DN33390_c0_g1_i1.p1 TRINITY_DN33390_c0_g1~~TRINITY_DN33390_c0_g1_i1.p1  ORF type:complete len:295 (-),score=92.75 TRINITY_DN33390_c0_g1_i1:73-957(-)